MVLAAANDIVIVHRQEPASPGAASTRLERLVESAEQLGVLDGRRSIWPWSATTRSTSTRSPATSQATRP